MRQRRLFLRGLCAALLILAAAGRASAQMGRVNGIVKDDGGQPLKGATITAENPNIGLSYTATTDDKGRFTLIGLRAGNWRFIAQAPGFSPDAGEMPVRMGGPNPPISFVLKKSGVAVFGALGGITSKDLQNELSAADALFKQSRWDDAVQAYRNLMEKSTALVVLNLQIGAAYRAKKDYPAALAAYDALLKADPGSEKARVGIAMTNLEKGDAKAAEDALLKAAEGAGAGREVFFQLGEMKTADHQSEDAARWYQKASAADPAWGKPVYKLALAAMQQGDSAGAAKLMDQVIAVDPVSPEAALAKSSLESLKK